MGKRPNWRLVSMVDEQMKLPDGELATRLKVPAEGWVARMRAALGVTEWVLGTRLAITQQAVSKLERSEQEGRITIGRRGKLASRYDEPVDHLTGVQRLFGGDE